ncbi:MAG: hypothetical protein VB858_10070, partial [Planctomycetaceae bacterium]
MRIRSSRRIPYLGRRDQFRLAVFAALMGAVVIAMQRAGDPASWYWLTGNPGLQEQRERPQVTSQPKIDFSVNADEELFSGNTVRIVENAPAADRRAETDLSISPQRLALIRD